jgi:uncharacterized protein YecT (DUF1311 family)
MKRYLLLIAFLCAAATLTANSFAQSQAELTESEYARFERADAKLNKVYKKLLASADAVRKEKLVKAQRAWLAYRDAEATLESDGFSGGTAERMTSASVMANLTEDRVKALEDTFSSF